MIALEWKRIEGGRGVGACGGWDFPSQACAPATGLELSVVMWHGPGGIVTAVPGACILPAVSKHRVGLSCAHLVRKTAVPCPLCWQSDRKHATFLRDVCLMIPSTFWILQFIDSAWKLTSISPVGTAFVKESYYFCSMAYIVSHKVYDCSVGLLQ